MAAKLGIIIALSLFFGFSEYFEHRIFNEKHPDQNHCHSLYGGFLLIAAVSVLYLFI